MTVTRKLLEGDHPVLVYAPDQTHPPSRIVVYIHGYAIDRAEPPEHTTPYVDFADREHHLGPQFFHAVDNQTLVIIPESPKSKADFVRWTDSQSLLDHVKHLDATIDTGALDTPIAMIGHSGAYRTMFYWRKDARVDEMHLIDALYAYTDDFQEWLEATRGRKLTLVVGPAGPPRINSERLVARTKVKARVREPLDLSPELGLGEIETPLLYWRTNMAHMDLVKSGKIIPQLLRRAA